MSKKNMLKESENRGNNKGQVTIFIIVAIIIVVGVIIYFIWLEPSYVQKRAPRLTGFDGCVQDAIEGELGVIGEQGGYLNPEFTYLYQGNDVAYLCYTNLYYKPCVMQEPFLKQHVESNLKMAIGDKINTCYEGSISELKAKGHDVESGVVTFEVMLEPGQTIVQINAPTSVGGQRFVTFDSNIPSPIYEMLMISTSILQYETKFGDSDTTSIMMLYDNFIIDKMKRSDGTTIYTITDKLSETKFQFASRSFPWPAGYGFGQ